MVSRLHCHVLVRTRNGLSWAYDIPLGALRQLHYVFSVILESFIAIILFIYAFIRLAAIILVAARYCRDYTLARIAADADIWFRCKRHCRCHWRRHAATLLSFLWFRQKRIFRGIIITSLMLHFSSMVYGLVIGSSSQPHDVFGITNSRARATRYVIMPTIFLIHIIVMLHLPSLQKFSSMLFMHIYVSSCNFTCNTESQCSFRYIIGVFSLRLFFCSITCFSSRASFTLILILLCLVDWHSFRDQRHLYTSSALLRSLLLMPFTARFESLSKTPRHFHSLLTFSRVMMIYCFDISYCARFSTLGVIDIASRFMPHFVLYDDWIAGFLASARDV